MASSVPIQPVTTLIDPPNLRARAENRHIWKMRCIRVVERTAANLFGSPANPVLADGSAPAWHDDGVYVLVAEVLWRPSPPTRAEEQALRASGKIVPPMFPASWTLEPLFTVEDGGAGILPWDHGITDFNEFLKCAPPSVYLSVSAVLVATTMSAWSKDGKLLYPRRIRRCPPAPSSASPEPLKGITRSDPSYSYEDCTTGMCIPARVW